MSETKSRLPTPEGILSYPKVWTATVGKNAFAGAKPTFSTAICFTSEAMRSDRMKAIFQAVLRLAKDTFGDQVNDVIVANAAALKQSFEGQVDAPTTAMTRAGNIKLPFRFDVKANRYPDHIVMFMSAATADNPNYPKPDVLKKISDKKAEKITDTREIYPGVFAMISVSPYVRQVPTNKGISLALGSVMKLRDCAEDERLIGGAGGGASDFDMEEEDAAPSSGSTSVELDVLLRS